MYHQELWIRKQILIIRKGKHFNNKESYTDGSKSTRRKLGFAAVFKDCTRRGPLPEEASNYIAKQTAIKIAMREIQRKNDMKIQRKPSNIKTDISHTSEAL